MSYDFRKRPGHMQPLYDMADVTVVVVTLSRSEHTLCHHWVFGSENEWVARACPCEVRYGCVAERMSDTYVNVDGRCRLHLVEKPMTTVLRRQ